MPRRPTPRQLLERLAAELEPELRAAFLASIEDIVSNVQLSRVIERLERGDIEGALSALNIEPAAFRQFEEAIRRAFISGGSATMTGMPALRDPSGNRLILRFDARNPRAEQWLAEHSSALITRIVDDQRSAIRQALREGMEAGTNPRTTALDIAGRINRATGKREGGIVGLTAPQERYVASARRELLSGDPDDLRHYLTRGRRDKRFDRTVAKAIREGKPLPRETVNKIVGRYSDRLLELRAETIARTETMASLNQAHIEAFQQAIDTGSVRRQDVRKVWVATKDNRTRDSHWAMDGESTGIDDVFSNGLRYPGDPNGSASETANCRCTMFLRVDHLANLE